HRRVLGQIPVFVELAGDHAVQRVVTRGELGDAHVPTLPTGRRRPWPTTVRRIDPCRRRPARQPTGPAWRRTSSRTWAAAAPAPSTRCTTSCSPTTPSAQPS